MQTISDVGDAVAFRCPDVDSVHGGVRAAFRHARWLKEAGFSASIVSPSRTGLSSWISEGEAQLLGEMPGEGILVVPEADIAGLKMPGDKVLFTQSMSLTGAVPLGFPWASVGVVAALAVSEAVACTVRARTGFEAIVVHPSVNTALFRPSRKESLVAYMPRRNKEGIERILASTNLASFRAVPIDGLSQEGGAGVLSKAAIFLAASPSEGFGLPPLEAMASGCLVVGYAGGGGLDYMEKGVNCLLAQDGIEEEAAMLLTRAVEMVQQGDHEKLVRAGLETARRFSPARERQAVLRFWRELMRSRNGESS